MITYHLRLSHGRTWILTKESERSPLQIYRDATLGSALNEAAAYVAASGGRLKIYRRNGMFGSEQFFHAPPDEKQDNLNTLMQRPGPN
jgi:hypothetical protein